MTFADGKTVVRTACADFRTRQPDGMWTVYHGSSGGFGVEFGDEELELQFFGSTNGQEPRCDTIVRRKVT